MRPPDRSRVLRSLSAAAAILALVGGLASEARADWLSGWSYRKALTISNAHVDQALTSFPLSVRVAGDTDVGAHALASGNDLRFTAADGLTLLPYERESFAVSAGSATGDLWVSVPGIASGASATIFMYYGNASAADGQDRTAVWDASFLDVYHFAETAGSYLDSTSHANACATVTVGSRASTGRVHLAPTFTAASGHRIDCGASRTLGDVTLEAWVYLASTATYRAIAYHGAPGEAESGNSIYSLEIDGSNLWSQWEYGAGTNETLASTASVPLTTWTHVAAVRDTVGKQVVWYVNGAPAGSSTAYTNQATGGDDVAAHLSLGVRGSQSAQFFDGLLDELRISGSARPAAWIKFTYYNVAGGDTSWGPETKRRVSIVN